jgi:hypothetical protein
MLYSEGIVVINDGQRAPVEVRRFLIPALVTHEIRLSGEDPCQLRRRRVHVSGSCDCLLIKLFCLFAMTSLSRDPPQGRQINSNGERR